MSFLWAATGLYLVFILLLTLLFNRMPGFQLRHHPPQHSFTIIIPFRNEQANLTQLIEHLNRLKYNRENFEVIFINDQSTDRSVSILSQTEKNFASHLLHSPARTSSPKKEALRLGIENARFPYIITLDADAFPSVHWLTAYNDFLIENPETKMIIGPVLVTASPTPLEILQQTEMYYLQGLTAVGAHLNRPFLANGANLMFEKSAFEQTQAFASHMNYAGGDDIFLVQSFSKSFPGRIKYLKSPDAIVSTQAHASFRDMINQHLRWAKKMFVTANAFTLIFLFVLSIVYFTGISLLFTHRFTAFFLWSSLMILLHYIYIRTIARFFKSPAGIKRILTALAGLPVLYAYLMLLILFNKNFTWKGRSFSK